MTPSATNAQPWSLSLRAAAEHIHDGRLRPSDLVASALSRIEQVEPQIHAFVIIDHSGAAEAAARLDAEAAAGRFRGPLHGIPIAIKDMIDVRGFPTRRGSAAFADAPLAVGDAEVVAKLRRAGAIVVGKTTTHEFALGATTPPTRNPWDLQRSPGGSSGGSAAAVAAGAVFGALGTDTLGSVRMPAALCGIVGIKPTYERVSRVGVVPLSWSLDCVGPLARTVDDAAKLLTAILGGDVDDVGKHADLEVGTAGSVAGLRIGVVPELFLEGIEAPVAQAMADARALLAAEGATCVEIHMPEARGAMEVALAITRAEYGFLYEETLRTRADLITERIKTLLQDAQQHPAVAYLRAQQRQEAMKDHLEGLYGAHGLDALLSPTVGATAVLMDQARLTIDGQEQIVGLWFIRNTLPFSLTGQPAISVPAASIGTLPIGLQVAAPAFGERVALRIGRVLERAGGSGASFRLPTGLT